MLAQNLIELFFNTLKLAFEGLDIIGLPFEAISALQTIFGYGAWVVGVDLLIVFAYTIAGWWIIKLTVGLIVWIWELLPMT